MKSRHSLKYTFVSLIFLVGAAASSPAYAAFAELPTSMSFDFFGYKQNSMGNLCYSIDSSDMGRPCHPARLAEPQISKWGANFEWGLGNERKSAAEKILDNKIDPQLVADLYKDQKPVLYSGGGEIFYQTNTWNVSLAPYKIYFYSHSRNPAFPLLDLHAVEQRDVKVQLGTAVDSNLLVGANLKLITRKFVHDTISFYDLLVNEDILKSREQDVLLMEPGLLWSPDVDSTLKPELSLMASNFGFQNRKYEGFSIDPTLHAGAHIAAPVEAVNFKLGIELDSQNPRESHPRTELWRVGTLIGTDWFNFTYSANQTEQNFGITSKAKYFYSGIIYEKFPERFLFNFSFEI